MYNDYCNFLFAFIFCCSQFSCIQEKLNFKINTYKKIVLLLLLILQSSEHNIHRNNKIDYKNTISNLWIKTILDPVRAKRSLQKYTSANVIKKRSEWRIKKIQGMVKINSISLYRIKCHSLQERDEKTCNCK